MESFRFSLSLSVLLILFLFAATASSPAAGSDEYFGRFSKAPVFEVKTNINSYPTFILKEDFSFLDPNGLEWTTPKNAEVDGASIPRFAWSFVGAPMSGNYIHASIIHDYYCHVRVRTAHDTHRAFLYGMRANGVSKWQANFMYWAVNTFGPTWTLRAQEICEGPEEKAKCTTVLLAENVKPSIDESNSKLVDLARAFASDVASGIYMCSDCYGTASGSPSGRVDPSAIEKLSADELDKLAVQARRDFELMANER